MRTLAGVGCAAAGAAAARARRVSVARSTSPTTLETAVRSLLRGGRRRGELHRPDGRLRHALDDPVRQRHPDTRLILAPGRLAGRTHGAAKGLAVADLGHAMVR